MPTFSQASIQQGIIKSSSPSKHNCLVQLDSSRGQSMEAIECGVLQSIGGPRDTRASIYLPEIGAKVLVLVNSHTRGMIIGYLPESSSESLEDPLKSDDP